METFVVNGFVREIDGAKRISSGISQVSITMNSPDDTTARLCPIVLACDEGYAMPLATTMLSIVESNRRHWPIETYVLSPGFSKAAQSKVLNSCPPGSISIKWITVSLDRFRGFSTLAHISAMTYARFLIPELLDHSIYRALYLDADILVLGDLGSLCGMSFGEAYTAAVEDHGLSHLLQRQDARCAGMPRVQRYFNAGVLLIDVDKWRSHNIGQQAFDYLRDNPQAPFADQDALNFVLDGHWLALHAKWNYQNHLNTNLAAIAARDLPDIVHFVTSNKPWKPKGLSRNTWFYDQFRSRTQYPRSDIAKVVDALLRALSATKRVVLNLPNHFFSPKTP